MNKSEFEEMTGIQVSDVEFSWVMDIFMLTDETSKQEFCKCFKRFNLQKLVKVLVEMQLDLDTKKRQLANFQNKAELIKTIL
jgi:hypothetical protein